jgi:hypothetical protein
VRLQHARSGAGIAPCIGAAHFPAVAGRLVGVDAGQRGRVLAGRAVATAHLQLVALLAIRPVALGNVFSRMIAARQWGQE